MIKPLIQAELGTQNLEQSRYARGTTTKNGRRLAVGGKNVSVKMVGERD